MVQDIGNYSAGHSHVAIPTTTKAAVSEDTPHTPHPVTAATGTTLWPMDDSITTHAMAPTDLV